MAVSQEFVYPVTMADVEGAQTLMAMRHETRDRPAGEDRHNRFSAVVLQSCQYVCARANLERRTAMQGEEEDTDFEFGNPVTSEANFESEISVTAQPSTKSASPAQDGYPTPPDTATSPELLSPLLASAALSTKKARPTANRAKALKPKPLKSTSAAATASHPGRNKRKADQDGDAPAKKTKRVPGGKVAEHLRTAAEKFGGRMKLMSNDRQGTEGAQEVLDKGIFSIGRSLHPKDGPGSDRYVDECKVVKNWGFTEEKGNMTIYYNHKDRLFEGVAMLLEHNLRNSQRDPEFVPLPLNKTQAQRWLQLNVQATSAMLDSYIEWGWLPVVLPTLTKDGKLKGELTSDRDIIDAFYPSEVRRDLYQMLIAYDNEHHPNDAVFVRS